MARILIIDDDAQVREMLRQTLTREGYDVVGAPNGLEGVKLYREKPADLVITDLIMPEQEGIQTIIELRREFPDVKIIAISGGGRLDPEPYLEIAKGTGVQYTFTKPIDRQALLGAIRQLIKSSSG